LMRPVMSKTVARLLDTFKQDVENDYRQYQEYMGSDVEIGKNSIREAAAAGLQTSTDLTGS